MRTGLLSLDAFGVWSRQAVLFLAAFAALAFLSAATALAFLSAATARNSTAGHRRCQGASGESEHVTTRSLFHTTAVG